jgi:hypothetical protein
MKIVNYSGPRHSEAWLALSRALLFASFEAPAPSFLSGEGDSGVSSDANSYALRSDSVAILLRPALAGSDKLCEERGERVRICLIVG